MREKGENSVKRAGKAAMPDEIMISALVSKVNPSHLAVVGYLEQATLGASSFEGIGILHERDSNCFAIVS